VDTEACREATRGKQQSQRSRPALHEVAGRGRLRSRVGWRRLRLGVGHASTVRPDPSTLGVVGERGSRQLRLHDPTRAEAALQESARRLGAGKEKHQSVILADLSTAFVVQDDPEQACAVLHQVIDLVELTGSAAGKRRAFAAGRQLTRWRNEPFVQDVQDRLLALAS
jgi:hypothetical protein